MSYRALPGFVNDHLTRIFPGKSASLTKNLVFITSLLKAKVTQYSHEYALSNQFHNKMVTKDRQLSYLCLKKLFIDF
jgi:hypothetical protein